ncbi:helix-turn-helix domain-containing protein [Streptomyces sp. NPDC001595]|uniref:helix-turn-helix domain-containing protein n=1 Tax=Streptomyces sp. NPDC001532 TaxID=3154520 RepID=UPI0033313579
MSHDLGGPGAARAPLGRLADVLGAELIPAGPGAVGFAAVAIAEPGDPLTDLSGALVLAVGARGAEAVALLTAAHAAGAAAVAVRRAPAAAPGQEADGREAPGRETPGAEADGPGRVEVPHDAEEAPPGTGSAGSAGQGARGARRSGAARRGVDGGRPGDGVRRVADAASDDDIRAAAARTGIALLAVPTGLRWDEVETVARAELARAAVAASGQRGDLYSLAQTLASLTHGLVSVEDTGHRVLAYAGPADDADELRRRSILGRSCPEPYLALLRDWGVFQRLRESDEVVEIEARPELGVRRRLAAGVHAGARPLGTVWVQEGDRPLSDRAAEALRGTARLAASQLVDHYYTGDPASRVRSREELAHGLLTGRFNAAALAGHLGIAPTAGASVVAVDLRDDPTRGDSAWRDARLAEAAEIVSVHAAAYRRDALVAQACGQIYAMLPQPFPAGPDAERALLRWATDVVSVLRAHARTPVQAVVAGTAGRLDDIPAVKLRGHHGLEILARTPERAVETHDRLTSSLMVREAVDVLARHGGIRHQGLAALVAHDTAQGTELARSLRLYLDAFGDVAVCAKELKVHPNTLRYRVRKAVALAGLDLDDPEHRLAAMLGLRLLSRERPGTDGTSYFPL